MGELTGRKVFAITAIAFGIIITVNVTLAVQAVRTFPGLEVANSYVASQRFDTDRAAQEALGWTADAGYEGGTLTLVIRDKGGRAVDVDALEATIGRPTHVRDDDRPAFDRRGGVYAASVDLGAGLWVLRFSAAAPDGTQFRQHLSFEVKG
ncbi:MAG: FixH family protein [Pseudomonadota bacterium]